jgi:hypothetical protein
VGLIVFQLLVWGLVSFPRTRVFLITVFLLAVLVAAIIPFGKGSGALPSWKRFEAGALAVFAVVWLGAGGAAWLAVNQERRGRWTGRRSAGILRRPGLDRELILIPLTSQLHAQFWAEWRRNGRLPLIIWTVLVWVVLGTDLLSRVRTESWLSDAVSGGAAGLAVALVAVTGLNLARDPSSKSLALSSFSAVRPVNTGTLFEAKLLVGGTLWLAAALIAAASYFVCAVAGDYLEEIKPIGDNLLVVVVLLGSIHLFVGILPLCLWGRMPGFPWSLLPLLAVYSLFVNGVVWAERHHWLTDEALFLGLSALLVIKLVTAFWAFRRSLLRRLSTAGFVARYVVLWVIAAVLVIWGLGQIVNRGLLDVLAVIPGALLALPLARIAICPLALDLNRHR